MTVTAVFGGRVQVDCSAPGTMKAMIVLDGMRRAVPESKAWDGDSIPAILFSNLIQFLGRTSSLGFEPDEDNPDILAWRDWWELSLRSTDYRQLWEAFIALHSDVNTQWSLALEASEDMRLKAPEIVQPGAPSDAELKAAGPDGKKNLRNGMPTSTPSTKKQRPSSTVGTEVVQ